MGKIFFAGDVERTWLTFWVGTVMQFGMPFLFILFFFPLFVGVLITLFIDLRPQIKAVELSELQMVSTVQVRAGRSQYHAIGMPFCSDLCFSQQAPPRVSYTVR